MATPAAAELVPPHVLPPERQLGRLGFLATFLRNPLEAIPRAAYEQDAHPGPGRLWITAPALIRAVLLDERERFQKVAQIRLLGPLLGRGILTSEGAEWKWQRQVISATLLPSADATVAPVVEHSMTAFQRWSGWNILYAATGMPRWMPRPGMAASARAIATLRGAVHAMLGERRAAETRPDDLMHRLMSARDPESGRSMDERQLVDNLLTFYLAGHETTARALAWTLYLLARSPEWSARLAAEIARVTGGGPVAAGHIERLVEVQQVLKESMRLYPPVPLMGRQAVVPTALGGHALARGATVMMPIYAIHRHVKRWRAPDRFDPARFAPENEAKLERYQYMPFGAGPRICIGMAFAMLEATAMLATLLQHARFAPVEGHEPYPVARVTLVPRGGMPLRVSLN
jgi:cytochrome P450